MWMPGRRRWAGAMRDEMNRVERPHLIAGQQAFAYKPKFRFPLDQTYGGKLFDIVNVHPLPDTVLGGSAYQLGQLHVERTDVVRNAAGFCRESIRREQADGDG